VGWDLPPLVDRAAVDAAGFGDLDRQAAGRADFEHDLVQAGGGGGSGHLVDPQCYGENCGIGAEQSGKQPGADGLQMGEAAFDGGETVLHAGQLAFNGGETAIHAGELAFDGGETAIDAGQQAFDFFHFPEFQAWFGHLPIMGSPAAECKAILVLFHMKRCWSFCHRATAF